MIFEIFGTIKATMNERSGVSAKGEWKSCDVLIEEMAGNFVNTIKATAFGEDTVKLAQAFQRSGDKVKVAVSIGAREYEGRYYNDVRVREIRTEHWSDKDKRTGEQMMPTQAAAPAAETKDEDLPF